MVPTPAQPCQEDRCGWWRHRDGCWRQQLGRRGLEKWDRGWSEAALSLDRFENEFLSQKVLEHEKNKILWGNVISNLGAFGQVTRVSRCSLTLMIFSGGSEQVHPGSFSHLAEALRYPRFMRDWRLFSHLLAGRQGLLVGSSPWHPQNSGPCFSFVGPGVEGVQFTFQQIKHRYGKPTAGKPWAMLSCCARETMGWSPAWRKTAPLAVQVMPCASWRMVPLDSNQSSWRAAGMWPLRHCERFAAEGCHGENFKAQS